MLIVGLTGGMGMGKSTADRFLRERGVPVIDTDEIARSLVEPGMPALLEICQTFGTHLLDPHGRLKRQELASLVFQDNAARTRLEAILHPRIREAWRQQAAIWRSQARGVAVVIIPLLFETGAQRELDRVICVACSETTRRERLRPRGWSSEQIEQRISAQMPITQKMSLSNYVVWTEGSLEVHARQLDLVLARI